ncbi:MAG: DNA primase large subunit [Amphiamblys sp. WSBS2006]|nr:MAG: DNA primase large subunit [Amphiamblys sp. WSBS2006]
MKRIKREQTGSSPNRHPVGERCTFYEERPLGEIHIDRLVELGKTRIGLLNELETESVRGEEDPKKTYALCRACMPLDSHLKTGLDLDEQKRNDRISHLILLLSLARSRSLTEWFQKNELLLFKFRYNHELLDAEKKALATKYIRTDRAVVEKEGAFHVPFEKVLGLVSARAVVLRKGTAVVEYGEVMPLLARKYEETLQASAQRARKSMEMCTDRKILSVVETLVEECIKAKTGNTGKLLTGKLSAGTIDTHAFSFPPCMERMHVSLSAKSHLKHIGRQQYGMFLKSIGVPLSDSLLFWKRKMLSKFTEDEFEKSYAYNIRHNYGKEGKRFDYPPHTCTHIIGSVAPGPEETHGCPFRDLPLPALLEMLQRKNIPENKIHEIAEKSKQKHYQAACGLLLGAQLDIEDTPPILFPADFYKNRMPQPANEEPGQRRNSLAL